MRSPALPMRSFASGMIASTLALGVVSTLTLFPVATPAAHAATSQECTASTRLPDRPPALDQLQAELAWGLSRGKGVTVAVVDSGVSADNPHLTGAVKSGYDLVEDGLGNAGQGDLNGHGTAIAGQIAARESDRSGIIGLAPEAQILPIRVFADTEEQTAKAGYGFSITRLAEGIRQAVREDAQIISVSLSTAQDVARLSDAVAYAASEGSLVIASAGNADSSYSLDDESKNGVRFPAGAPGVLGVTALSDAGIVTDASVHGPHVDLAAPGQNILTASAVGGDCNFASERPSTSYATAYVAAAAALVASAHPNETPAQWAYRLQASALRANPDARDDVSGWGVVQPYDAIVLVPGADVRGPELPPNPTGNSLWPTDTAASSAPAPSAPGVTITHQPRGDEEAIVAAARIGIVAAVFLGIFGTIGIWVLRRRRGLEQAPTRTGTGLYGDDTAPDDDSDDERA